MPLPPDAALRQAILASDPGKVQQALRAGACPNQAWQGRTAWVHAALTLLPQAPLALASYPDAATLAPSSDARPWVHAQWEAAQEEHARQRRAREVLVHLCRWRPWPASQTPRLLAALAQSHPDQLAQPHAGASWVSVLRVAPNWPTSAEITRALQRVSSEKERERLIALRDCQIAHERDQALAQQPVLASVRSRRRV